jgi:peptide-methionine (S)-S-oxide reductase
MLWELRVKKSPFNADSSAQQGIIGRACRLTVMNAFQKRLFTALALFSIGFLFAGMTTAKSPSDSDSGNASIVLGGGCFWCVEALYETLEGVTSVESGYAGGHDPDPTYEEVCSGSTGHAEVVKVAFDPARIRLESILDFFWEAHDPTTLNRQGADVGTQYRSIILTTSEAQRAAAEASKAAAQKRFAKPIVTEIKSLETFHKAEKYHQDYFKNNPNAPYCQYVIAPKLKKLES